VTGLFIHPYLDEDVSVLIAALLRARSFAVTTTVEAANPGAADEEQLSYAAANGMAILTHNRIDFERLALNWLNQGKSTAASSSLSVDRHTISSDDSSRS
jgi:hypothetical protein